MSNKSVGRIPAGLREGKGGEVSRRKDSGREGREVSRRKDSGREGTR